MKINRVPLFPAAVLFTVLTIAILALTIPMVSSAQTTYFAAQMDFGARGEHVSALQRFLASDSTIYPEGIISGYFGVLTQRAVSQFQAMHGLPSVGRVGPLTLAKLNSLAASGGLSVDVTAPNILSLGVSTGAQGTAVLSWSTNEPARAKVYYSTNPIVMTEANATAVEPVISGAVVADTSLKTNPVISLSNLQATSTYYYVLSAIDASGNVTLTVPRIFRTNP